MNNSSSDTEGYISSAGLYAIVVMTLLGVTALLATLIEHKKFHVITEAGVAVLIGFFIGLIVYLVAMQNMIFNTSVFFFVLLPIIIFKEGYSLNKQHFFKNFFYVFLYGILGTVFNYILIAAMTYGLLQTGIAKDFKQQYMNSTDNSSYLLVYSACITSKDSAVALSVMDFQDTPKLHSIIFGEQILNDVVVFSLQKSSIIMERTFDAGLEVDENGDFKWFVPLVFIGIIIAQILVSFLVGIFFGTLATWITKKCRFFVHHSSVVTAFTIYFGYLSFALCEAFQFCGVIAVLVCGVMLSHYQTYNLPKISAQSSKITVRALGYISETFIYIYIGCFVMGEVPYQFSHPSDPKDPNFLKPTFPYSFFAIQLLAVIPLARFFSMLLAHGFAVLFRLKTKGKWRINRFEFLILFYSGLIRGVVSEALFSELYENGKVSNPVSFFIYQRTVLLIVFATTIFVGGSLRFFTEKMYHMMERANLKRSSLSVNMIRDTFIRETVIAEDLDEYKRLHPKSEKRFKLIDENYVKPFLIYNYLERKDDIKQAKMEEKKKILKQEEEEEKLFDDSVRHRREQRELQKLARQQQQSHLTDSNHHDNDNNHSQHKNGNGHPKQYRENSFYSDEDEDGEPEVEVEKSNQVVQHTQLEMSVPEHRKSSNGLGSSQIEFKVDQQ